jgi:hypothetical protein
VQKCETVDRTEFGSFSYDVVQERGKFSSSFKYALSLGLPSSLLKGLREEEGEKDWGRGERICCTVCGIRKRRIAWRWGKVCGERKGRSREGVRKFKF